MLTKSAIQNRKSKIDWPPEGGTPNVRRHALTERDKFFAEGLKQLADHEVVAREQREDGFVERFDVTEAQSREAHRPVYETHQLFRCVQFRMLEANSQNSIGRDLILDRPMEF